MNEVNMKKSLILLLIIAVAGFPFVNSHATTHSTEDVISGEVIDGRRILRIENTTHRVHLKVYRGDYIKFEFDDSFNNPLLKIPALSIEKPLPANLAEAPYFKMKSTGTYAFSLGRVNGVIEVVEYRQPRYAEVSSEKAAELIKKNDPLILDVRTLAEHRQGHIQNSMLIPVQELQSRLKELTDYKNREILIYCATGNRSTVASKILIDNDFKQIINLRYGIYEWYMKKFPIVR